jgi:antitoxin Phd
MTIFTYSEARQKLSTLLNTATRDGEVLIRRRDGRVFSLRPQKKTEFPFDVEGITTKVSTKEIVDIVRESRSGAGRM